MDDSYQLLIMASDGVWEFITSQEAVDIVQNVLNDVNNAGEPTDCDDACQGRSIDHNTPLNALLIHP